MVVKIPADKLCKLKAGIQSIVREKKIKLKDLESVVGLMAFCARALSPQHGVLLDDSMMLYYPSNMQNHITTSKLIKK